MCTLVTSGQVASNTLSVRWRASVLDRARDAVRGEDDRAAAGHLVELVDEHRAQAAQSLDHVAVVHDLVAHVDRRPEQLERTLDDVDRAVDAGAEAARIGEQDLHVRPAAACAARVSRQASRSSTAAPTVMAESATLKAGKYASPQCTWMKSTTRPSTRRSIMLPSAPPTISDSPQASRPWWRALRRRIHAISTAAHDQRQQHEHPALPAAGAGEEAEGGTGVVGEDEVQHRQHVHALGQREVRARSTPCSRWSRTITSAVSGSQRQPLSGSGTLTRV